MLEPKGTLGTSVNGPEDLRPARPVFDGDAWELVDWRRCEEEVRRLRRRIFKAAKDGDLAGVRDLQQLMLRSWFNVLVSVRQATHTAPRTDPPSCRAWPPRRRYTVPARSSSRPGSSAG